MWQPEAIGKGGMPGLRKNWSGGLKKLRQESGCLLKTLNIFLYICVSSFGHWYKLSARKKIYLPDALAFNPGASIPATQKKGPAISRKSLIFGGPCWT